MNGNGEDESVGQYTVTTQYTMETKRKIGHGSVGFLLGFLVHLPAFSTLDGAALYVYRLGHTSNSSFPSHRSFSLSLSLSLTVSSPRVSIEWSTFK